MLPAEGGGGIRQGLLPQPPAEQQPPPLVLRGITGKARPAPRSFRGPAEPSPASSVPSDLPPAIWSEPVLWQRSSTILIDEVPEVSAYRQVLSWVLAISIVAGGFVLAAIFLKPGGGGTGFRPLPKHHPPAPAPAPAPAPWVNAPQCAAPYINLTDAWRSESAPGDHSDTTSEKCPSMKNTNVGNGSWYRFVGGGLTVSSPGPRHCGADAAGWLSGWGALSAKHRPPSTYNISGTWPTGAAVVNGTVCFDQAAATADSAAENTYQGSKGGDGEIGRGKSGPCASAVAVAVVRCNGARENSHSSKGHFLLWQLEYSVLCGGGYCTQPVLDLDLDLDLASSSGRRGN